MQVRRRRRAVAVKRCCPPEEGCCCDEDHCFGFHCFGQLSRRRARHTRPTRTALLTLVGRCVVCALPAAAAIASHAVFYDLLWSPTKLRTRMAFRRLALRARFCHRGRVACWETSTQRRIRIGKQSGFALQVYGALPDLPPPRTLSISLRY